MAAARKAFEEGPWPKFTPTERGRLLFKLADLIERDLDTIASVESLDNGKSITLSKGDLGAVLGTLRYYGGWADKIHGKVIETKPDMFNVIRHEPIGVCGQIIPWNFPLLMVSISFLYLHITELTFCNSSHGKLVPPSLQEILLS